MDCYFCHEPISWYDKAADEVQYVGDAQAHSDCYYGALGEVVEEHPIPNPARGR